MTDNNGLMETTALTPSELLALDDAAFKRVVDEELRGKSSRNPQATSGALRAPEVLDRLHLLLVQMQRNTEGLLAAKAEEFDALKSSILVGGRTGQDRYLQERGKYATQRAATLRFKTALEMLLLEIKAARSATHGRSYDAFLADDRDRLGQRVRALETAIQAHRAAAEAVDLEPELHDLALWSCVGVGDGKPSDR